MRWHIVTGEYPPQPGGVSDYTRAVARGLQEAGDQVHVWAPASRHAEAPGHDDGVAVHRLAGRFGRRAIGELERGLDGLPAPRRLLVQYVPHAFGWKGANVPFCRWLARRDDEIWVMFHEVAFPMGRQFTARQNALGAINRLMARTVVGAASRVFISTPAWREDVERSVRRGTPVAWIPVPSGIPVAEDGEAVAAVRARYAGAGPIAGHFGTYGSLVMPGLEAMVDAVVRETTARVLLIGRGSVEAARALAGRHRTADGRIIGVGELASGDVSCHVAACDVMLQPYPDGVSTRRTSAMAALAHGKPMLTTAGALTESLWAESGAVVLASADDRSALAQAAVDMVAECRRWPALARRARALYDERFSLRHTIEALRA
jgi:glycosyltransferase involved in cell wall biosynthesis